MCCKFHTPLQTGQVRVIISCQKRQTDRQIPWHHILTLGNYIAPKKTSKIHRYRSIIGSGKIDSFMWIESIIYNRFIIQISFLDRKVLKTINNRLITVLNQMDPLKHWIKIIFVWSTKKNPKKICNQK